jgi:UDP-N-acetylmuramoyl-tripeptide--D-alanyl-D-alanine ligase
MIKLKLAEIVDIVGGIAHNLDLAKSLSLTAVIDSKAAKAGTFFAAFKGENTDGHSFIKDAIANGAEFALVSKAVEEPHILVPDVLVALTKLAKHNRTLLTNMKVVAVTGSHGKTTAKDLMAHLLGIMGNTVAPQASLNNELGVPLLLIECNEETKYCIVEMGARHKGDIAHLTELANPNIGVVLNVGHAHIGEFGSQEVIAEAKGELIAGLVDDGVAILGSYDSFTPKMSAGMGLKTIIFGENTNCDVRAADIEAREGRASFDLVTPAGRAAVTLALLGMHQIANALAAAAVALELGMAVDSVAAALSTAEPMSKWRMQLSEVSDVCVINDSYNANPESMHAALRTLALIAQERGGASWAILGKMHELGASEAAEHESIGKIASDIGIDHLVAIGVKDYLTQLEASETSGHFVASAQDVLKLVDHFAAGDVVLVKASRAEKLELLAEQILEALSARAGE